MLLIRARVRPCSARACRSSRSASRRTSLACASTRPRPPAGAPTASLPSGLRRVTVRPSTATLTPSRIGHRFLSDTGHGTRSAWLRDYQTSQSTSPPSLRCRASRSLITPRLVLMIEMPRPPRTGLSSVARLYTRRPGLLIAADAADHALAVGAVLQVERELRRRARLHFLPVPDVAFALEHFRQAALDLGERHVHVRPFDAHRIADAGQHVGDRVGHHGGWVLPLPTRLAHTRNQSLVRQLAETDPADAELPIHRPRPPAQLAAPLDGGWKTSAAAEPWRFSIYLPLTSTCSRGTRGADSRLLRTGRPSGRRIFRTLNGMPNRRNNSRASSSLSRRGHQGDVHALDAQVNLSGFNSGNTNCSVRPRL